MLPVIRISNSGSKLHGVKYHWLKGENIDDTDWDETVDVWYGMMCMW